MTQSDLAGKVLVTRQAVSRWETGVTTPGVDMCKLLAGALDLDDVGAQVGDELAQNGLNALIMVVVGVMIYLAVRFEWKFAVAAIIANLHDIVIILGFFAFFQWEFSLSVLAGVLAVLG